MSLRTPYGVWGVGLIARGSSRVLMAYVLLQTKPHCFPHHILLVCRGVGRPDCPFRHLLSLVCPFLQGENQFISPQ
ncbi:hypothetical protein EDB86DRAFT_3010879, partial [Lactarius hatsudake]